MKASEEKRIRFEGYEYDRGIHSAVIRVDGIPYPVNGWSVEEMLRSVAFWLNDIFGYEQVGS